MPDLFAEAQDLFDRVIPQGDSTITPVAALSASAPPEGPLGELSPEDLRLLGSLSASPGELSPEDLRLLGSLSASPGELPLEPEYPEPEPEPSPGSPGGPTPVVTTTSKTAEIRCYNPLYDVPKSQIFTQRMWYDDPVIISTTTSSTSTSADGSPADGPAPAPAPAPAGGPLEAAKTNAIEAAETLEGRQYFAKILYEQLTKLNYGSSDEIPQESVVVETFDVAIMAMKKFIAALQELANQTERAAEAAKNGTDKGTAKSARLEYLRGIVQFVAGASHVKELENKTGIALLWLEKVNLGEQLGTEQVGDSDPRVQRLAKIDAELTDLQRATFDEPSEEGLREFKDWSQSHFQSEPLKFFLAVTQAIVEDISNAEKDAAGGSTKTQNLEDEPADETAAAPPAADAAADAAAAAAAPPAAKLYQATFVNVYQSTTADQVEKLIDDYELDVKRSQVYYANEVESDEEAQFFTAVRPQLSERDIHCFATREEVLGFYKAVADVNDGKKAGERLALKILVLLYSGTAAEITNSDVPVELWNEFVRDLIGPKLPEGGKFTTASKKVPDALLPKTLAMLAAKPLAIESYKLGTEITVSRVNMEHRTTAYNVLQLMIPPTDLGTFNQWFKENVPISPAGGGEKPGTSGGAQTSRRGRGKPSALTPPTVDSDADLSEDEPAGEPVDVAAATENAAGDANSTNESDGRYNASGYTVGVV